MVVFLGVRLHVLPDGRLLGRGQQAGRMRTPGLGEQLLGAACWNHDVFSRKKKDMANQQMKRNSQFQNCLFEKQK